MQPNFVKILSNKASSLLKSEAQPENELHFCRKLPMLRIFPGTFMDIAWEFYAFCHFNILFLCLLFYAYFHRKYYYKMKEWIDQCSYKYCITKSHSQQKDGKRSSTPVVRINQIPFQLRHKQRKGLIINNLTNLVNKSFTLSQCILKRSI